MGGESIRLIDLPALRKGRSTIFDLAPVKLFQGDEAAWAKATCKKMRKAIENNHGVAICKFVERVMTRRDYIGGDLDTQSRLFVEKVTRKSDSPTVKHLASSFAHVYAGGVVGVQFGILPWTEGLVMKCVKRCYLDARRAMRSPEDLLRSGLKTLRKKIESGALVTVGKKKPTPKSMRDADGYIVVSGMDQKVTVRAETFKSWFKDRRQPRLVSDWLLENGAVTPSRKPKSATEILWAATHKTWPDGTRARSIVLDLTLDVRNSLPL